MYLYVYADAARINSRDAHQPGSGKEIENYQSEIIDKGERRSCLFDIGGH